ncbi:MAG TPA: hypothetical protein VMU43_03645 [Candidatus Acidoferrum sp.]|nr:hypothetical protein [Candidatus Acidoferrum sp.]
MNESAEKELKELLQRHVPRGNAEPRRDLWPQMLKRMEAPPRKWAWLDWALAGTLLAGLLLNPGTILVLLYHL